MKQPKNDELLSNLPAGLAQPALRALSAAGIIRLEQFTAIKESDLLKMHGIGPKAIDLIRKALETREQAFAGPGENNAADEEVFDSPIEWVKSHIQGYVESDGKQGQLWGGLPILLLTTRGRKSGKLRRTSLICGQDGKNYLVVASNGGAPDHPLWYLNLVQTPEVQIQVGAEKFTARARTAALEEKPRLWKIMRDIFPQYDEYQAKAGREIPLVILEPLDKAGFHYGKHTAGRAPVEKKRI